MYDQEPMSPLLSRKKTSIDMSFTIKRDDDPIQKYNYVIQRYNAEENLVDHKKLTMIRESGVHRSMWKIMSRPCRLFLFLLFITTPVFGLFLFIWFLSAFIVYFAALGKFNENAKKVSDPFQNMVFSPELCRISQVSNKFYDIKLRDLDGFSFNPEVVKKLKVKNNEGDLKVMVYNSKFWDFYHDFPKLRRKYIFTWCIAGILLGVQGFLSEIIYRAVVEERI